MREAHGEIFCISCPWYSLASQTRWVGKHEPSLCNLMTSHYLIFGNQFLFFFSKQQLGSSALQHYLVQLQYLLGEAAKLFNTDTHKTRGWGSHREMMRCALIENRQQRETGRRERDTQTEGSSFFLPLPHPFLSPHLVGLDSSLQVLDPFVSLCS